MEKYAIIKLGGKQFIVSEGDIFTLERQETLEIDVLLYSDGKKTLIGEPVLADIKVLAENMGDERARKIRIGRFRAKSRHRRVYGHAQPLSRVKIVSIGTAEELAKVEKKVESKASTEEKNVEVKKTSTSAKTTTPKAVKATKTTTAEAKTAKVTKKGTEK